MKSSPKNPVILVAEDDPDDRLLARDAFAEAGSVAIIKFVENGEELMSYLKRENQYSAPESSPRPSFIIIDLNMPKMDGREALQHIRKLKDSCQIPVVVLTTSNADPDIAQTYEHGANSFITKPVSYEALVKIVKMLDSYWLRLVELPRKGALC